MTAAYPDTNKYLTKSRIRLDFGIVSDDVEMLLRQHAVQVAAQRLAIMRAVYDALGVLVDKNLVRLASSRSDPQPGMRIEWATTIIT